MTGAHSARLERTGGLGMGRRLSLAVTAGLHRVMASLAGVALAGLPRAGGFPVLRGAGTSADARAQLEAALALLEQVAPGLKQRLQANITGLFLLRRPPAHGYYSRITGTCSLDVEALQRETPIEIAAAMVRCATEGWLWRSGRGRSQADERRILEVSELARLHFLQRAVQRMGASL